MNRSFSNNLAIIGISTGGPQTYGQLFTDMPTLNGCIVLVQHMPQYINRNICEKIAELSCQEVILAADDERLRDGAIYIAPSGSHLLLTHGNRRLALGDGEPVNFCRPSIDVTMQSLSNAWTGTIAGVVMTGMGQDGAGGISHIKKLNGITIAQSLDTSIISSMPRAAIATHNVDFVLSPQEIQAKLVELFGIL